MVAEPTLLKSFEGGVARLTLNRPKVHNAFDGDLIAALLAALDEAAADPALRVVVLAASGRSFCAGADLRWMAQQGANAEGAETMARVFERLDAFPKPVIARVQGAARGGGTGLVSACDIVVATASASFQFSEVRLGLAPAVISPYVIARIGVMAAREFFVTGERFDAERALGMGMVNYVLADEAALEAKVLALCTSIRKGAPQAVIENKRLARTVMSLSPDARFEETSALIARLRAGDEGQEGMRAFISKRRPAWYPEHGDTGE